MIKWLIITALYVAGVAIVGIPFLPPVTHWRQVNTKNHSVHIYAGRTQGLNDGKCTIYPGAEACEDLAVDKITGLVYLGCGSLAGRLDYYPPQGHRNINTTESIRDGIFIFNPKNGEVTELAVRYRPDLDLVLHGLGVYYPEFAKDERLLFFVNHQRKKSFISIFKYIIGSDVIFHEGDVEAPAINTPNGVVPLSPTSFIVTNDHHFRKGFWRDFENNKAPLPWSNVVSCDFSSGQVFCDTLDQNRLSNANGILLVENDTKLLVSESRTGLVAVYNVTGQETKKLVFDHQVYLGASLDNLSLLPNDDVLVAAFPQREQFNAKIEDPFNSTIAVPSMAIRLKKRSNYKDHEIVFWSDGTKGASAITTWAYHENTNQLIGSSVVGQGILACKVTDRNVFYS
ncbi:hypothetical protein V1514DRAFT_181240 [Lipomyces japonicus]|uniref:uncharacterized protein n=1 Tax=Lipomyces japonicus TaxID=56871 RepID=UPI0034CE0D3A